MSLETARAMRREVIRKYRQVGILATLKHTVVKLFRDMRGLVLKPPHEEDTFDARYGTDTSGTVGVGSLDIPESQMDHAMRYGTLSEEEFTRLMKELPIVFNDLT